MSLLFAYTLRSHTKVVKEEELIIDCLTANEGRILRSHIWGSGGHPRTWGVRGER
jgi:hypothetical protein